MGTLITSFKIVCRLLPQQPTVYALALVYLSLCQTTSPYLWTERPCARIAYRLDEKHWIDSGRRFPYRDSRAMFQGKSCQEWCTDHFWDNAQQYDDSKNLAQPNKSIAKLWEDYMTNPDPCHAASGLCLASQYMQADYGDNTQCRCGFLVSLMRVHKYGLGIDQDGCVLEDTKCSFEDVANRFQNRFPSNDYHLNIYNFMSNTDVQCEQQENTCDCTKLEHAICTYERV